MPGSWLAFRGCLLSRCVNASRGLRDGKANFLEGPVGPSSRSRMSDMLELGIWEGVVDLKSLRGRAMGVMTRATVSHYWAAPQACSMARGIEEQEANEVRMWANSYSSPGYFTLCWAVAVCRDRMHASLPWLRRVQCQASLQLYFQGEENAVNISVPRSTLPLSHECYLHCVSQEAQRQALVLPTVVFYRFGQ